MTGVHVLLKKHWKPPYSCFQLTLFLLLFLVSDVKIVAAQNESSLPNEDIVVNTESTPYTIRFYLNNTEKYELLNVTCKGIKNVEHVCNEDHVCENLDPCSQYFSTVTIKNLIPDADPAIIERTIEVGTAYAEPQTIMNPPIPDKEFINLTWSASNRACVKSFQIEAVSADKQSTNKNSVANDISEQKIEILFPCQEYNIQLKTENVYNAIVSNQTATTNTLYAEPEITTVNIENYDNGQVKVTWEPPKSKTCVNYFYLKWTRTDCKDPQETDTNDRQSKQQSDWDSSDTSFEETTIAPTVSPPGFETENTCVWYANITDAYAKEYVISNLQGCEDYIFQIFINNNLTTKYEQQNFMSPEQAPGIVTSNNVLLNATTAHISWNPPVDHRRCIEFYRIYTTGPLQRDAELQKTFDIDTTEIDAIFDNLEPCGHYNYTVVGISHNGTVGESMNATYDTLEAKPTLIRNYRVIEEAYNITITWDPPYFADLCLNGYRVTAWRDEVSQVFYKATNDTTIVVDELYSCQWYTVQIIATTQTMDGEVQQIEAETRPIVSQAPNNFQAIGLYPNSFELSATEAGLSNKCETIFARFTCELSKNVDVIYKRAEQYVEGQVGGITFKALLSPLSPYTEYRCNVGLFNIAGWSANRTIIARTEPYFPDPPEKVSQKSSTNSSINFIWKAPKYANGNIKLYISHFQRVLAAYYVPPGCELISSDPFTRETSSLEQSYPNLKPYTVYSIQVAAQNEYGVGDYTMPYMVKTLPSISDPITNLKVMTQGPYASVTEYKANVVVSWNTPCKSNGDIEAFLLDFVGDRVGYERIQFQRIIPPKFNKMGNIEYNETRLNPEFNYTVSVAIKVVGVEQLSARKIGVFDSPAGIPERLDEAVVAQTKVDAYEANNPTNSAVVRFPAVILNSESGSILYVALLLSEKHCNQDPELRFGALDTNLEWPNSPSWSEAYKSAPTNCIYQYQTTPERWKPSPLHKANDVEERNFRYARDTDEIEYVIGTEKCDDSSKRYCNGPLKPDTEYNLVIRLFTKSGYNDATLLEFKTDSLIQITIILISVVSCLLLAFIAGFIYLWITKRIIWQRASYHGIVDSFGDVIGKNFAIFYRDVSKPEKVQREFKELTVVAMDLSYSASEIGCNKNRYADIFPYDKNRVILDIDAEGSDYINASFIDGYRRKKEYIATQGPKPESTLDFWRMILQHNVRVIVQVTQFREGDCIKCHEYFPYKSKTINVSVKKRDCFEIYDRTEMSLTHDKYNLKQKVTHYYFKKWPDHGCPKDPNHLITFVRKVKAEKVPSYSPIVVHCSAGVGRTGTFIGLDIIMQRLRGESKINIYETVKKLRFQRMKMVQTLAQYSFLYSCAYELVKHKNTRAALKFQNHNTDKKVSFQEDPEINGSPVQAKTLKFNGRRSGSDLSSVDEHYNDSDVDGNSIKQVEVPTYGTRIRFNTMRKSSDLDSLGNHADDEDSVKADNRADESVM